MNPDQLQVVKADLEKSSITNYGVRQGNGCLIVSYGRTECYYLFTQDNQLIEIIFD
jgi:hypothetical protein